MAMSKFAMYLAASVPIMHARWVWYFVLRFPTCAGTDLMHVHAAVLVEVAPTGLVVGRRVQRALCFARLVCPFSGVVAELVAKAHWAPP